MHPNRLELASGLWADPRGVLWIQPTRTLVIADLHLGYAWVQRQRGALLPVVEFERLEARLLELQAHYAPEFVVFLGDLVHAALPAEPVAEALHQLLNALARSSRLVLTLGNHDRRLAAIVSRTSAPLACVAAWRSGAHLLAHGDDEGCSMVSGKAPTGPAATPRRGRQGAKPPHEPPLERVPPGAGGFLITGHEHPALELGDGVATRLRCPCFLVGPGRLMLPAFSGWAAGVIVGRQPFMSRSAREARWSTAVAILGERLLRLPLEGAVG